MREPENVLKFPALPILCGLQTAVEFLLKHRTTGIARALFEFNSAEDAFKPTILIAMKIWDNVFAYLNLTLIEKPKSGSCKIIRKILLKIACAFSLQRRPDWEAQDLNVFFETLICFLLREKRG